MKRRLLSLFMAMVMVCSLVPGALAAGDDWSVPENAEDKTCQHAQYEETIVTQATCKEAGSKTLTCKNEKCKATKTVEIPKTSDHTWNNGTVTKEATCTAAGETTYTCSVCTATKKESIALKPHTRPTDATKYTTDASHSKHTYTCTVCSNPIEEACNFDNVNWVNDSAHNYHSRNCKYCNYTYTGDHTYGADGECTLCGAENPDAQYSIKITSTSSTVKVGETIRLTAEVKKGTESQTSADVKWSTTSSNVSVDEKTGDVTGVNGGTTAVVRAEYTIPGTTQTIKDEVTVKVTSRLAITTRRTDLTSYGAETTLYAEYDGVEIKSGSGLEWRVDGRTTSDYVDLEDNDNGTATVTARKNTGSSGVTIAASYKDSDGNTHSAEIKIVVKISTQNAATVTVYTDSSDYYLSDSDDEGDNSIESQLDSYFSSRNSGYYGLESVIFSTKTDTYGSLKVTAGSKYYADGQEPSKGSYYSLSEAYFTPGSKKGSAVFSITANVYTSSKKVDTDAVTCTITFKVEEGVSSGDVTFYGAVGEDVPFDSATFEDFWDDKYSGGDLDYVTFSVSGGTLRDGDSKTVSSKKCYVSPGRSDIGLDEVYFEPSSTNSKKATTVTFSFTAYGEDKKGNDKEASGRVSIVYMSDSPKDISYTVGANGAVSLKASDFTAAYKEVISGTVPSNLTIVFQGAPKNGTLTYNDSSKKNAKDVTLTNSSIKKYSFTTKSSGSNQLNDITYSGTSGTDTIEYTAYSGSTPKFKGNVVFNGKAAVPTDVSLYYASTAGQPARFSQNDFATANSVLSKAVKYRFAAPSNGTLYLNGTTSAVGIDVASSLLSSVTYQPKAGYNGSDKVVFMAYDASNALVASGTVNITIAGNPSTTNPSTPGSSGGVTDVSQFTDVSSTAWYRSNLATLVQKGVITGRGNGKFDPRGTVTYGEALKMVLQACGYTATVGTGSQWAINYKNLAVSRGWISNDIDLNAAISRNATAELAAKVLGVSPVTSGSPFADEANAYAVALYYTTPQVFVGSTNPNGGKPLFQNSSPLLREQVCAVICRVMDYHTQHTTNTMPDGT